MRAGILKHLLILFFVFSLMEKAGVSVLSLMANNSKEITECLYGDCEDDASRPAESKEASVKEFWIVQAYWAMPVPFLYSRPVIYADAASKSLLSYIPSVPTPPPNHTV